MGNYFNFSDALEKLKDGEVVTRKAWAGNSLVRVKLQKPDENSKMTEPYLYMEKMKGDKLVRFPLDLSCESILADDWMYFVL